jgi:hypothetical protein
VGADVDDVRDEDSEGNVELAASTEIASTDESARVGADVRHEDSHGGEDRAASDKNAHVGADVDDVRDEDGEGELEANPHVGADRRGVAGAELEASDANASDLSASVADEDESFRRNAVPDSAGEGYVEPAVHVGASAGADDGSVASNDELARLAGSHPHARARAAAADSADDDAHVLEARADDDRHDVGVDAPAIPVDQDGERPESLDASDEPPAE